MIASSFDGVGNYDSSGVFNNAGTVNSGGDAGTYTVAADGTLTVTSISGNTTTGA